RRPRSGPGTLHGRARRYAVSRAGHASPRPRGAPVGSVQQGRWLFVQGLEQAEQTRYAGRASQGAFLGVPGPGQVATAPGPHNFLWVLLRPHLLSASTSMQKILVSD